MKLPSFPNRQPNNWIKIYIRTTTEQLYNLYNHYLWTLGFYGLVFLLDSIWISKKQSVEVNISYHIIVSSPATLQNKIPHDNSRRAERTRESSNNLHSSNLAWKSHVFDRYYIYKLSIHKSFHCCVLLPPSVIGGSPPTIILQFIHFKRFS